MSDGLATGPAVDDSARKTPPDELLSALAGHQAARERAAADRTRRVVRTSWGVLEEQKAGHKRTRAIAVSALLLVLIVLGPFLWRATDELIGGEPITDIAAQAALWACILSPAILAAVLVAGWLRHRG